MASLAIVAKENVRLVLARAIDNATKLYFAAPHLSAQYFDQIRSTTKTKLCWDKIINMASTSVNLYNYSYP